MRIMLFTVAMTVLLTAPVGAQVEPMPRVPMLDQLVRTDHLIFEVESGQITLSGGGMGGRNSTATGPDRSETLQMRLTPNESHLNYQLTIPTEVFAITVSGPQTIHVERTPKGDSSFPSIAYIQRPGRPVLLNVVDDDSPQSIEASTLWHLLLAAPELCRKHLLPMLGTLGPDWDLEPTMQAIEEGLLRGENAAALAERTRWSGLVEQLADDSFARREAADRELRAGGSAALGFLRQLDFAALLPEQQYRVRRIVEAASGSGDTAENVVAWLSGDAEAWLLLAMRDDLATRETAAARLAEILDEPVQFDPRATEAARASQLDALRARLR